MRPKPRLASNSHWARQTPVSELEDGGNTPSPGRPSGVHGPRHHGYAPEIDVVIPHRSPIEILRADAERSATLQLQADEPVLWQHGVTYQIGPERRLLF